MFSVSETIEFESVLVTASPSIWIVQGILYWPPEGSSINRSIVQPPGPNWKPYKCTVLKSNIETFKEALELEKMYSKHRNSSSFHEFQEQQKLKRKHPVNSNQSQLDLIDVNDMINEINGTGSNGLDDALSSHSVSQYHEGCGAKSSADPNIRTVKKPVSEVTTSSFQPQKEKEHESIRVVKKTVRKPLPFQHNYLKSKIPKAKDRAAPTALKPKCPRYDNFLKSGNRFNAFGKSKAKVNVPTATITKQQHLQQNGNLIESDLDDGISAPKTFDHASTPLANNSGGMTDFLNTTREVANQSFERNDFPFIDESDNENVEKTEGNNLTKVPDGNPIRPAANTSSQGEMSFQERILKELCDLKKSQQTFETRMEKKIETLFNDQSQGKGQPRMQSQPNMQGNSQFMMQRNAQMGMQSNGRLMMQGNSGNVQARMQYPSRQTRTMEQMFQVEYYQDDYDDYEEIDQHFPVNLQRDAEDFELSVRQNLEFKFRLCSRLNDLAGNTYKKCIRLKMKHLFTDSLLETYSWRGTNEKRAFRSLTCVNNLILRSVRHRFPNVTRDEYKDYMVQWIKHARSRQRTLTYSYPPSRNLNRDGSSEDEE